MCEREVRKGRKVDLLFQNSPTVPLMSAMLGIKDYGWFNYLLIDYEERGF